MFWLVSRIEAHWRALKSSLPRFGANVNSYYSHFYEYLYRKYRFTNDVKTDFINFLKDVKRWELSSEHPVYDYPDIPEDNEDGEDNIVFLDDIAEDDLNDETFIP